MNTVNQTLNLNQIRTIGIGIPAVVLMLLSMMILPLPSFLLDILFTFNITLSLLILLAATYARRPLDFNVFPTILLVSTLLRLALNVASTRVVLLRGHTGSDAAGQVIESFGEVVIGGSYAVGLVVFVILVIINFVVVTKGAGRISEVSARFTLDSMPGKQMAIDADLNAGIIDQNEAKTRREEVSSEADFYGAMDGASKFVRGDAIAGILILFINVIGGLFIGTLQHGLTFGDALHVYSLLTIGDGLVAQLPSLLLSTAAAMLVTRVSTTQELGDQFKSQMFVQTRPLIISAGIMFLLGIIPGMPHLAFLLVASILAGAAYLVQQNQANESMAMAVVDEEAAVIESENSAETATTSEVSWDDVPLVDDIALEVGFKLIPLVDDERGGELMSRIKGVRKKLSQELGFLVPSVHIRDDLNLIPNGYRISIMGIETDHADIHPDKLLAINPGEVLGAVQGLKTVDPAFGMEAFWIPISEREQAQTLGYTVVDPSTVIATHLSQVVQSHAHELFGHAQAQKLLEKVSQVAPKLIEEHFPSTVPMPVLVKVLQNLLKEKIPIRDIRSIVETLVEFGGKSQDPSILTEITRSALSRVIIQQINGTHQEVPVVTLAPSLEQILQQSMQQNGDGQLTMEPGLAEKLQQILISYVNQQAGHNEPAILLVSPAIRRALARYTQHAVADLHVISFNEIPEDKQIKILSTIGGD